MRAELVERLSADGVEPGFLALLAGINTALLALDAEAAVLLDDAEPADRAIVTDDGREIRLRLYGAGGAVARVVLEPARAVRLGNRLIAGALPKLLLSGGF